jgi:hypothetical protein
VPVRSAAHPTNDNALLLAVDANAVPTDQLALPMPEFVRAEAYEAVAEPTWVRAVVVS